VPCMGSTVLRGAREHARLRCWGWHWLAHEERRGAKDLSQPRYPDKLCGALPMCVRKRFAVKFLLLFCVVN
jgi:hypothetical protein